MRKSLAFALFTTLLATSLLALTSPSQATTAQRTLTTCTDLATNTQVALKASQPTCRSLQAPAIWHSEQSDSTAHSGAAYASLRICSSKNPTFTYQYIRSICPKSLVTTDYWRTLSVPATPTISSATALSYDGALLQLAAPKISDAPVAYYLVKNLTTGATIQVQPSALATLTIAALSPLTSYTFSFTAVSIDGRSQSSLITQAITTTAIPVVYVAPSLAAPAFTLSASHESRIVNTPATGFSAISTGGAIASFAISPVAPSGMSLNTTTGAFSGTPTTLAGATTYTITATNATGSATAVFNFTVTAIGSTGPGGGTVFYYLAAGFSCGAAFSSTGSPTGGLCHYLEVAPSGWNTGVDPIKIWANLLYQSTVVPGITDDSSANNTSGGIGLGYKYSSAIVTQGNDATTAAGVARAYTGAALTDWYLPTTVELNQLCKYVSGQAWGSDATLCIGSGTPSLGFIADYYWSSSEYDLFNAWDQGFYHGDQNGYPKLVPGYVRPVRAF